MDFFFINNVFLIGLMIFSMTFGSGNLVLPLATGYACGSFSLWGLLGFFVSSVIVPQLGFFAVSQYQGDYKELISQNSHWILATAITACGMILLGPLCIPRCTVVAYGAAISLVPGLSKIGFNIIFIGACYLLARNKSNLINIIAKYLAPATLGCLAIMMISGFLKTSSIGTSSCPSVTGSIYEGFSNGWLTLDLLAMVFYSRIIFQSISEVFVKNSKKPTSQQMLKFTIASGLVAASIFALIYGGMILCSGLHSGSVLNCPRELLLPTFGNLLLGSQLGFIQSLFVGLACFSTSFALMLVFADYLTMISKHKISYQQALFGTTAISMIIANFNFAQISSLMMSMMMFFYPPLILIILFVFFKTIFKKLNNPTS